MAVKLISWNPDHLYALISHVLLTLVQSRIILSIFVGGTMASSTLTANARISGSTWKKEKTLLIQMGLLSYSERKEIHEDGIRRVKYYSLTEKGNQVAVHVGTIANLLGQDHLLETKEPLVTVKRD